MSQVLTGNVALLSYQSMIVIYISNNSFYFGIISMTYRFVKEPQSQEYLSFCIMHISVFAFNVIYSFFVLLSFCVLRLGMSHYTHILLESYFIFRTLMLSTVKFVSQRDASDISVLIIRAQDNKARVTFPKLYAIQLKMYIIKCKFMATCHCTSVSP